MASVKTKKRSTETLLADVEMDGRRELTPDEEKMYQESLAVVVEGIAETFSGFIPSLRRTMYMSLFAKTIRAQVPKEIVEKLKPVSKESIKYFIDKFSEIAGKIPPLGQRIILAKLIMPLDQEEAEYEKGVALDQAFDKVLDALSDWTTEELLYLADRIESGALHTAIKRILSGEYGPQAVDLEAVAVSA